MELRIRSDDTEEREGGRLGWFSVRNIEEVFPQLHQALSDVAASFRHSGE